jgi:hypothetical protein
MSQNGGEINLYFAMLSFTREQIAMLNYPRPRFALAIALWVWENSHLKTWVDWSQAQKTLLSIAR